MGQKKYTCRIEPHSVFYDNSGTWINIISKDTLVRCHPGEYLHLEGNYYKVDSVASDGRYLRMTLADHPENIYSMQEGFRPMPFTARTTEGKEIHFPEDFSGKYVLLDFWSTGCGPCVEEIRHTYPRLYDRFKEKGFEILGIAFNSEDEIIRFKERYPMPWLVISDAQKELQNLYRIQSFPTLVLINPQGTVEIKEEGGELRGHHLGELLENLLLPEDPAE